MTPKNPETQPLWKEEVSILSAEERYVSRRQFGKFLVLTSVGMLAGNVWIAVRAWLKKAPYYPERVVADVRELAIGGVKLFSYPGPNDPCLLVRLDEETFVAYSQKCTHLSCAVYYSRSREQLVCPCHHGYFSAKTGAVIQGPPPRALPRVRLSRRGARIVAVGMVTDA